MDELALLDNYVNGRIRKERVFSRVISMHQHSWGALHWSFMVEYGCVEGGIWGWSTCAHFQVDCDLEKEHCMQVCVHTVLWMWLFFCARHFQLLCACTCYRCKNEAYSNATHLMSVGNIKIQFKSEALFVWLHTWSHSSRTDDFFTHSYTFYDVLVHHNQISQIIINISIPLTDSYHITDTHY